MGAFRHYFVPNQNEILSSIVFKGRAHRQNPAPGLIEIRRGTKFTLLLTLSHVRPCSLAFLIRILLAVCRSTATHPTFHGFLLFDFPFLECFVSDLRDLFAVSCLSLWPVGGKPDDWWIVRRCSTQCPTREGTSGAGSSYGVAYSGRPRFPQTTSCTPGLVLGTSDSISTIKGGAGSISPLHAHSRYRLNRMSKWAKSEARRDRPCHSAIGRASSSPLPLNLDNRIRTQQQREIRSPKQCLGL
jgi:hypothetical protein